MSSCTAPGTHAGLNRHRKAWEQACPACLAFARDYAKRRRAENPAAAEQARRESRIRNEAIALRALCAQTDPEMFFPEKGGNLRPARAVCAACPVTAECLELWRSLPPNQAVYGVWGGRSSRERRPAS